MGKGVKSILKQMTKMQQKMAKMQEDLDQTNIVGSSGGGAVTVELSGNMEMKHISIEDDLINPEEKDMLVDMIITAYNNAKAKLDVMKEDKMSSLTAGLPLPPGLLQ